MTTEEAVLFLADHGVVLEADRGPVPNRVEAVVGEPISGSKWGYPSSSAKAVVRGIFR